MFGNFGKSGNNPRSGSSNTTASNPRSKGFGGNQKQNNWGSNPRSGGYNNQKKNYSSSGKFNNPRSGGFNKSNPRSGGGGFHNQKQGFQHSNPRSGGGFGGGSKGGSFFGKSSSMAESDNDPGFIDVEEDYFGINSGNGKASNPRFSTRPSTMETEMTRGMSKRSSYMDTELSRGMSKRPSYMDTELSRGMSKRPSYMDTEGSGKKGSSFFGKNQQQHGAPFFGGGSGSSNSRSFNPRAGNSQGFNSGSSGGSMFSNQRSGGSQGFNPRSGGSQGFNPRSGGSQGFNPRSDQQSAHQPGLQRGISGIIGSSRDTSGLILGVSNSGSGGSIFGGASAAKNVMKLTEMLGEDQIVSGNKDEGKGNNSEEPPKIVETDISILMLDMGFKSLQSKIYSDENQELEGDGLFSYSPPTLQQAGF
ncbi:unnamed protein product [Moneuplotes crassus]|uniref:Uncharacterized protein n=1 Tax=Euplotes crassus TaxID=5936 RepID=A0AAD1UR15_EUPCR|nr:unnamed protein product [Moneuplotes crassus]